MLTQAEIAGYLLRRGLVSPRSIVNSDLIVRDLSSRNRNFAVESREGPCYLVKQGGDPDGVATVAHEAALYQALSGDSVMRRLVPTSHGYDEQEQVLVLELIRDAVSLRSHDLRRRHPSITVAAAIGRILGSLHRLRGWQWSAGGIPRGTPWVLSIHRPTASALGEVSATSLELLRTLQGTPGFASHLDRLRSAWRPESVVHNDVRWDNLVITRPAGGSRWPRLRLVDWEAACQGDPRWDLGSALAQYLSSWIMSIPITGAASPVSLRTAARRPLGAMQPAIRACWEAYWARRDVDPTTASRCSLDVVRFAAARLVQTAFEAGQGSMQVTGSIALHLQVSLNMLQRPHEAAVHLLGLRPPEGATAPMAEVAG